MAEQQKGRKKKTIDTNRVGIQITQVNEVRLALWGRSRGTTKTDMAGRIIADRVNAVENWDEVIRNLRVEAAMAKMPLQDYVVSILKEDFPDLDVEAIDWTPLLETSPKAALQEALRLLRGGDVDGAINAIERSL